MRENILSYQIYSLRKRNKLTQEDIAEKLKITPQSVSRWENGQSRPDVDMLPKIAAFFDVSIDSLFGYRADNLRVESYEKNYKQHESNWGSIIHRIERKVLEFLPPDKPLHILNIGCGTGETAVFFARNGYMVSACDFSDINLNQAKKLAEKSGLNINFFKADIVNYEIETDFDIIYACGILQYIPPTERKRVFDMFQRQTNTSGLNVINALVEKSFVKSVNSSDTQAYLYDTAEIFKYYNKDWKFELMEEKYFECKSDTIPVHQHCIDELIARKVI